MKKSRGIACENRFVRERGRNDAEVDDLDSLAIASQQSLQFPVDRRGV